MRRENNLASMSVEKCRGGRVVVKQKQCHPESGLDVVDIWSR